MRGRKFGLALGLVLAVSLVTAGAHAVSGGANLGGQGGAAGSTGGSPAGRMVAAAQTFRVITGNNATITIARACTAVGSPTPISTFVHCWLKAPNQGGKIYADLTRGEALNAAAEVKTLRLPTQPYIMCVQGWSFYRDGKKVTSGPPVCK